MPENTRDTILTITEKHNAANHVTAVYGNLSSKQITSNAIAQAMPNNS
jgi:hypothetical protein